MKGCGIVRALAVYSAVCSRGVCCLCALLGLFLLPAHANESAPESVLDIAVGHLRAVLEVSGSVGVPPSLEVHADARYAIASIAYPRPRIVASEAFLSSVTGAALRFALAHEVAHLQLDHHAQLQQVRQAALAAETGIGHRLFASTDQRVTHHSVEYEADALAMRWCERLGCSVEDASHALSAAYGRRTSATASHPALNERISRMRRF